MTDSDVVGLRVDPGSELGPDELYTAADGLRDE
jgi:hypothetical protein